MSANGAVEPDGFAGMWGDEYGVPQPLLDAGTIASRVDQMAGEISACFAGKHILAVGLLTGAYVFLADLSRRLRIPHEVAFVRARSYGDKATPNPDVTLEGIAAIALENAHVLLVEDLVDTGHTLADARMAVSAAGAASVQTCVLVEKDRPRRYDVTVDFVGFTVPDRFIVGYGIDYRGAWRQLPYIGWVEVPE